MTPHLLNAIAVSAAVAGIASALAGIVACCVIIFRARPRKEQQ